MKSLEVDIGDAVKAGDLLATLTIPELDAELILARSKILKPQAELGKAKAELHLAEATYGRLQTLKEGGRGAVSVQDLDIAKAELEVASAAVDISEAEVKIAEADLERLNRLSDYTEIRAPFDGMVVMRTVDIGTLVTDDMSDSPSLFVVARGSKMRLVTFVPDHAAAFVKTGQEASFTIDTLPGETFSGKVSRSAGMLESDTRRMRVEIDVANDKGRFIAGMFAKVSFPLALPADAVEIPARAVRVAAEHAYVFAVEDGKVAKLPVTVLGDDGAMMVVSGLKPGATVVVSSAVPVREGQQVKVE